MIKELREATGLGLGEAKAVADWLCREGGSINRLIDEVRLDTEEISYAPDYRAPGPFFSPLRANPFEEEEGNGEIAGLKARIEAIERWIRSS